MINFIDESQKRKEYAFARVGTGDTFTLYNQDKIFIKIHSEYRDCNYNAINLEDGSAMYFATNTVVVPVVIDARWHYL
jgi:hypothetical protein